LRRAIPRRRLLAAGPDRLERLHKRTPRRLAPVGVASVTRTRLQARVARAAVSARDRLDRISKRTQPRAAAAGSATRTPRWVRAAAGAAAIPRREAGAAGAGSAAACRT